MATRNVKKGNVKKSDVKKSIVKKRPRGRPVGSVSLTDERRELILACLRGGALQAEAAEVAGISPRTLREWIERGEGRSKRDSSAKLKAFATDVRQATGEAIVAAAAHAHKDRPTWWLTHAARSRADREGWTELKSAAADAVAEMSEEEARDELAHLLELRLIHDPEALVPRCSKPRCGCEWHRRRPA
jgi:transposase